MSGQCSCRTPLGDSSWRDSSSRASSCRDWGQSRPPGSGLAGLALALTRGVDCETVLRMEAMGIGPSDFFEEASLSEDAFLFEDAPLFGEASPKEENPSRSLGICLSQADLLRGLEAARAEVRAMERFAAVGWEILTPWDRGYPARLRALPNFPLHLFKIGRATLSPAHAVAFVGTRRATAQGRAFVREAVPGLAAICPGISIVSGLALGIDAFAHEAALQSGLPTIGVVAHGLNRLYPPANRELANRMLEKGGAVMTEYPFATGIHRRHFLERNRLIAGLAEGTVIVESALKGGALSTAAHSRGIARPVMAVPGRPRDEASAGCNALIARGEAQLVCGAPGIASCLGLQASSGSASGPGPGAIAEPPSLFPELEGTWGRIGDCLRESAAPMSVDELQQRLAMPVSELMAELGEMEFEGIVARLPGNRYELG